MVTEMSEKNAGLATNFSQAALCNKNTSKSLKLKAKRLKRSMNKRLRKSKEAVGSSLENVKGSFKGDLNRKNSGKKLQQKQLDAPNSGLKVGASQSQIVEKEKDLTTAAVAENTNQNRSEDGKIKRKRKKKNKDKKDELIRVKAPVPERKLGGMIFVCNAKTKSDCFHYKVMGLPASKKEVVLGVYPGLKLFLYDFDLKLLFGIFEAACGGGMNLEPTAFGGAFPAQVRFRIFKECLPIHESVFKNAIKKNYDERTKQIKTELSCTQVKKLRSLFHPIHRLHLDNQPVSLQSVPSSDPLYVTEEEYRSHGLRPEKLGFRQDAVVYVPPPVPVPFPDSYRTGHEDQVFESPVPRYMDTSSAHDQVFRVPAQPYMNENEYRMYGLRGRSNNSSLLPATTRPTDKIDSYQEDEYLSQNSGYVNSSGPFSSLTGGSSITYGSYSKSTVTEAYRSDLQSFSYSVDYHLPPRVIGEGRYTSSYIDRNQDAYNHRSHFGGQSELSPAPVSSRYSFAGALYSLR